MQDSARCAVEQALEDLILNHGATMLVVVLIGAPLLSYLARQLGRYVGRRWR